MFQWMKNTWNSLMDRRNLVRETDPEALRELSREIRDLAEAVNCFWLEEPQFRQRFQKIEQEMLILEEVIQRPNFKLVSPEKRLQLRKSLIQSREHLLEAVKEAPTASPLLQ